MEVKAQVLPFRLSKGAGTFRLGIVAGDESRWLDECSLKKTGDRIYIIKDALLEKGFVSIGSLGKSLLDITAKGRLVTE